MKNTNPHFKMFKTDKKQNEKHIMQKRWNKLCSLVKNCKAALSYQGLRLVSLALLFMMSTGYAMADAGSSAITGAVGTFKGYIDPVRNLLYVIAAVVSIIGAFNVFYKMNNGDQDVKKTIMMTIGGCAALVAMAVALPKFFGY